MLRVVLILLLFMSYGVAADTRVPQNQTDMTLSFAPLVRKATPAVVNIYARRIVETRRSIFADDPFFNDFFNGQGGGRRVQNSLGSGVILSGDGIVVSNYHVVEGATDIRVVLTDRREFSANVLLADPQIDLAILQLQATADMPYLTLSDSDRVEVGDLVLAIGNPFGVGQTVSSGIVSGLARSGVATGNARGYFIQTDAPINPGNSGGALVGMDGRLIGVNTSILTRSGGSNGIGFAIPAALVGQFVTQARAGNTRFQRPWAGMSGQMVDGDIAESYGLAHPGGVIISQLHDLSAYKAAGLRVGDVITAVDGHAVNTPAEMLYRMTVAGVGADMEIAYARGGDKASVQVRQIAAPETPPRKAVTLGPKSVLPGLEVANLNPAVILEFGLGLEGDGVVVTNTGPFGPQVGLAQGDILIKINGIAIKKTQDVGPALNKTRRTVAIEALRGSQRLILRFRG